MMIIVESDNVPIHQSIRQTIHPDLFVIIHSNNIGTILSSPATFAAEGRVIYETRPAAYAEERDPDVGISVCLGIIGHGGANDQLLISCWLELISSSLLHRLLSFKRLNSQVNFKRLTSYVLFSFKGCKVLCFSSFEGHAIMSRRGCVLNIL
mmetsp:Transcript_107435/g.185997  ORF Transcript_107435/g.185997 Transcript_107435/m.185997 type:complete len:152 (+) Transcript_107435:214-669(+)